MKRAMGIPPLFLSYTECMIGQKKKGKERTNNITALRYIRVSISRTERAQQGGRQGDRRRDRAFCFDSPEHEYCSVVCFSEQGSHGCALSDSESNVR